MGIPGTSEKCNKFHQEFVGLGPDKLLMQNRRQQNFRKGFLVLAACETSIALRGSECTILVQRPKMATQNGAVITPSEATVVIQTDESGHVFNWHAMCLSRFCNIAYFSTTKGAVMFKKTLIAGVAAAALAPVLVSAQQPPASPHTLTGNVGFFSQYIFRGLTQTNREPALQGGFDYSHSSGLYAGTWASNISWLRDGGTYSGGGSLEWDFYGGIKGSFGKSDFTWDAGTLYYWYPGDVNSAANPLNIRGDTWEIYGALGWKWLSAKYSYSVQNDTFGVRDSDGTWYLDLSANVPLGELSKGLDGLTLVLHWGKQKYTGTDPRNPLVGAVRLDNDTVFSYDDWKIGLTYALPKDFTIGAFYTDTSGAHHTGYGSVAQGGPFPRNISKGTGTVFIQKTF